MSARVSLDEQNLPIRYVAQATGVLPVTLRAWERRYGLLKPARTDKGHRLYSEADITTIRQVVALIRRGVPISKARDYLDTPAGDSPAASDWPAFRRQLAAAAESLDPAACLQTMKRAGKVYPLSMLASELLCPVEHIITQSAASTSWAARQTLAQACTIYLEQRSHQAELPASAAPLLLAGLRNTQHLPAAQLFTTCLREAGVDARWLGTMPDPAAFAAVLRSSRATGAIVWEDCEPLDDWEGELRQLHRLSPCPVRVGGELTVRHSTTLKNLSLSVLPSDMEQAVTLMQALFLPSDMERGVQLLQGLINETGSTGGKA